MPNPSDLMRRSWAFNWKARGRSDKTLGEMERHLCRFAAVLADDERDLLTATRFDCEQFLSAIDSQSQRNYAWRSLRSFYGFVAEEDETPSIMAKVKAPKVDLTEVSTTTEDDFKKLMAAALRSARRRMPGTLRSCPCSGRPACGAVSWPGSSSPTSTSTPCR